MEDFEILDLMEDLEGVGQGRQMAFKIDGTEVPREEKNLQFGDLKAD